MERSFSNIGVEGLQEVIEALLEMGEHLPVWTFTGDLGAGKTTLIKALAEEFGIQDAVSSPTFNYVNDYDGKLYHFDCYRLKNVQEALHLGLEEYLDSGKPCWVEWPEVISPLLPHDHLDVIISHNKDATRNYWIKRTT